MGEWRKSSYSQASGDCLEVRCGGSAAEVRDTKDVDRRTLAFNADEWRGFASTVKANAFGA